MRRQTKRWLLAAVGVISIGAAGPAAAQGGGEPIVTDRPDFTESADTVPESRFQIEGGYTFSRAGGDRQHDLGELLLRIGTGARAEVRVGLGSHSRLDSPGGDASGLQDASLGMKFRLAEGSERFDLARPNVALIAHTTLPTGARVLGENALQPEVKLCLGWDLSERWAMSSNLNYGAPVEGGERYGQFSGSLSFAASWSDRWGSFFEIFGFAPGSESGPNTSYFNTGVTYLVNPDYQLDFRVGTGLNGDGNDYFIGAGAARRW